MNSNILPPASDPSQPDNVRNFTYRPALGEICLIKGIAHKTRSIKSRASQYDPVKRNMDWITQPIPPTQAVYIGWRVLHAGEIVYDMDGDYEWLPGFNHKRSYYVWLFVTDERRKPVYVFPRDVERTDAAHPAPDADGGAK